MFRFKVLVGLILGSALVLLSGSQASAQSSPVDFDNLSTEQTAPWGIGKLDRGDNYEETISVEGFNTGGWTLEENNGRLAFDTEVERDAAGVPIQGSAGISTLPDAFEEF